MLVSGFTTIFPNLLTKKTQATTQYDRRGCHLASILKFSDDCIFSVSELIYYAVCSDESYGLALVSFLLYLFFCTL